MPKPTFLNLPAEKRNRIIELALEEFSTYPYRLASLSRIVARAGIAKGSMYQYFENKLDLYRWLVTDELERRRSEWLLANAGRFERPPELNVGLFAKLERMVLTQVGFMLAHPRLARLAANAMEPTLDEELRELHSTLHRQQIDGLIGQLRAAQLDGEIRANLDARALAHFIEALVRGTADAVLDRLGLDANGLLGCEVCPASPVSEWRVLVEQALDLIHDGVRHPARSARAGSTNDPRVHAQAHVN